MSWLQWVFKRDRTITRLRGLYNALYSELDKIKELMIINDKQRKYIKKLEDEIVRLRKD